jgi:hypothetical protein
MLRLKGGRGLLKQDTNNLNSQNADPEQSISFFNKTKMSAIQNRVNETKNYTTFILKTQRNCEF